MRLSEKRTTILKTWANNIMASRKPDMLIGQDEHGKPYLRRWWHIPPHWWFNLLGKARKIKNHIFCIYVHEGLHDDEDEAMHDHPGFSISIVLEPYIEHTPKGIFYRKTGDIVFRTPWALHRLEMCRDSIGNVVPSKSIFIFIFKFWDWGFACPKGWLSWTKFVDTSKYDKGMSGREFGCGEMS